MKSVAITHVRNEEYLIPYWVSHHKRLFTNLVLVDYHSTDNTVAITKEIAPECRIITSRNEYFDTIELDRELMEIEREYKNFWKICLNVSEFVFIDDLNKYLAKSGDLKGVRTTGVVMVDEDFDSPIRSDTPFVLQFTDGYVETERSTANPFRTRTIERCRFLHCYADGKYGVGRHDSPYPSQVDPNLFLLWFGFAPMTPEFRKRKTQILPRISERDRNTYGLASTHKSAATEKDVIENWQWEAGRSENLLEKPAYRAMYAKVAKSYGL